MRDQADREERNVTYIYERVTTKTNKQKQILHEYGYEIRKCEGNVRHSADVRPFGVDFAEEQRRRARPHAQSRYTSENARAYAYRPNRMSENGGAFAATKTIPLKLGVDKIVNFFESIEERANQDERIAKQRAVMQKKWSENKHNIKTALILLLITAIIVGAVVKFGFVVRHVDVYGDTSYTTEEIVAASGITEGEQLYSFRSDAVEEKITFKCPEIKSADVDRTVPSTVSITVEEDTPFYVANVWGDWLVLSSGLRVLGEISEDSAAFSTLVRLELPPVSYSVSGKVLTFADPTDERFVRRILENISSSLVGNGEITAVVLTDEYAIKMEAEHLYSLTLGNENDMELKLRMLHKTLSSGYLEENVPASIDLTTVGEACVRYEYNG